MNYNNYTNYKAWEESVKNALIDSYYGDGREINITDIDSFPTIQQAVYTVREIAKNLTYTILKEKGITVKWHDLPRIFDAVILNGYMIKVTVYRNEELIDMARGRAEEFAKERERDKAARAEKRYGENGYLSWRLIRDKGFPEREDLCIVKDTDGNYAIAKCVGYDWETNDTGINRNKVIAWRYLNITNLDKTENISA